MKIPLAQKVRLHDVFRSKNSNLQVEVFGKKGEKWKCRILTKRSGVYAGTHTLTNRSLAVGFDKI